MANFMQPQIILLREGTDTSQGLPQLVSNINACRTLVDAVRTTLGPRGMDKLVIDRHGTTISNDGATIMGLLDVVHPAAKTLVDIAQSQDAEVGDGTTSVVVLAGELLKEAKPFLEDHVHPQVVIKSYRTACSLAMRHIRELSTSIDRADLAERRDQLIKCAATSLNSKLISGHRDQFAQIAVDAVLNLDADLDIDMIGMKKVTGGSLEDSVLVSGVAFKKTFSYAGFEQQRKQFTNPKIVLLNVELELKAEKDTAEVRIESASEYQAIVDAEWKSIYTKLDNIVKSGAQIVLSRLPIGDLATQYFADRDMFCAGRVPEDDLRRVAKATGGVVQTSVNDLIPSVLGTCELFEEKQVGGERFNFFTGCVKARSSTVILRGGAEQFIEEADRSLHDAIMIVRRAIKHSSVVPGAGAIEMELSRLLRQKARNIPGKAQLLINAFAKALEVIPRQLTENAGFDSTNVLNKLRKQHAEGLCNMGVNVLEEGTIDAFEAFIWEPSLVKINAIASATEAATVLLSVDETIKNPRSEQDRQTMGAHRAQAARRGRGRGR